MENSINMETNNSMSKKKITKPMVIATNENYMEENPEKEGKEWFYQSQVTQNTQEMGTAQVPFKWSMNTQKYYSSLNNEIIKFAGNWCSWKKYSE